MTVFEVPSEHCFAYLQRAWMSSLDETRTLPEDDADETEEDRDLLELSETIDSGDDIDETDVAKDERRADGSPPIGETLFCHLSVA